MPNRKLEEITNYFLAEKSQTHAKLFLIHRSKHTSVSKKFHASTVDINDDLKSNFDEIVENVLQDVRKNYSKIKPFNSSETTDVYRTINKTTFPELSGLLSELENQADLSPITSFKIMKQHKRLIYCFQFKTLDKRIFLFSTIKYMTLGKNPENLVVEFKSNKLKQKKDELAILNKDVFCIYYEDIKTLLIIRYADTKKMLGFKEMFKNRCVKILNDYLKNVVSYDGSDLDKILGNTATNEFLLKNDARLIETGKDHYEKWNEVYESQKFTDRRLSKIVLGDSGKPIIKNPRDLGMILYAANNDIMNGVIKPREYALVFSKTVLRRQ